MNSLAGKPREILTSLLPRSHNPQCYQFLPVSHLLVCMGRRYRKQPLISALTSDSSWSKSSTVSRVKPRYLLWSLFRSSAISRLYAPYSIRLLNSGLTHITRGLRLRFLATIIPLVTTVTTIAAAMAHSTSFSSAMFMFVCLLTSD